MSSTEFRALAVCYMLAGMVFVVWVLYKRLTVDRLVYIPSPGWFVFGAWLLVLTWPVWALLYLVADRDE